MILGGFKLSIRKIIRMSESKNATRMLLASRVTRPGAVNEHANFCLSHAFLLFTFLNITTLSEYFHKSGKEQKKKQVLISLIINKRT